MTSFVESMESGFEAENSDAVTGPDNLPPLNLFEKEANDVRNHRVPWQSYVKWVFYVLFLALHLFRKKSHDP